MLFLFITIISVYLMIRYDLIRSGKATIAFVFILLILYTSTLSDDIATLLQDNKIRAKIISLLIIGFFCKIYYDIYCFRKRLKYQDNESNEYHAVLFAKRKQDLQRLKEIIKNVDIVGLDASWGMGKTFLLSYFKKEPDIREQYYVVEISVLTCKVDQLIPVLFHDLDQVLKKDGILSLQSESVKMLCDNQKGIRNVVNLLFGSTEGSAQTLLAFKKQLECMYKKVVIIYEDLDRVDDVKIIKQVLSINLLLSSPRIKIIYQYDDARMTKLGVGLDYLEKYIPHHIKLTELSCEEIVTMVFDELKNEPKIDDVVLSREDLMIFSMREISLIIQQEYFDWNESSVQSMLMKAKYTPRNVRFWIEEVKIFLSSYSFYQKADNKKLLIRLLYLKHILPSYYAKISSQEVISQILSLELKDCMQSLNNQEDKKKFLSDTHKKDCVAILDFLGYQLYPPVRKDRIPEICMHRDNEKWEEHNLRLDRIYHHIVIAGGHPQTNRETILTKIKKDVLSKDNIDEQYRAFEEIVGKSYYLNQHVDGYTTIQLIGHSCFEDVLDAAYLVPFTEPEEYKFLHLFNEKRRNHNYLDLEYIRVVRYANMEKEAIFSLIVSQMAYFNIIGNLLSEDSKDNFNDFMYVFFLACYKMRYITHRDYETAKLELDFKQRYIILLNVIKERIDFLSKTVNLSDQPHIKTLLLNLKLTCGVLKNSMEDKKIVRYSPIQVELSSISEQNEVLDYFLSQKKDLSDDPTMQKHFKEEVLQARETGRLNWDDVCIILSDKTK